MKRALLLFGLMLTGGSAAAQQPPRSGQFAPPPDDPSLGILREIFGNLVDIVAGNGQAADLANNGTVMGAGFEVFNVAVLFLGMIFVGYASIMGVINTAHDGEFLGRKMSSIWVPLRTVGGSALLLPLAGGFSAIQVLVMWLAVQGVGIGDHVWTAMLARVDQGGMIGHPNVPSARPLAANIFRFEVCRAAMNRQYADARRSERITVQTSTSSISSMVPTDSIMSLGAGAITGTGYTLARIPVTNYSWSATGGYMLPNVCGGLRWEESPQSQEGNARYLNLSSIAQVHSGAVNDMISRLRPIAEQVVAGSKPSSGAIAQAAYVYESRLQSASRAAVDASNESSQDAFVDFAKTGGWVHAGAYYNHIIQLNDAVQLAINAMPVAASIDIDQKETEDALIGYRDAMMVAEEYLKQRSDATSQAYEAEARADTDACLPIPTSWDSLKRCLSKPALVGIEQMTQEMAGSNTSHVPQVKGIGDGIMTVAWGFVGTMAATKLVTAEADGLTLGAAKGPNEVMEMLTGIITVLFLAMIGAGATMAFYVPLIPFIAWISGVIKWVVAVAEALIAAPIWAAAHIHPDGDDATGRAGPGYMIILSMILRPLLMLFGLMASIAVAQPIAHLVNGGFVFAVKGAMHDSANGIGAFVAYCLIYTLIMTIVLHAVFSLINYIPDKVLRFMGSAVDMHGVADSEAHESQRVFAVAASHGNRMVASAAGPSHGGGGDGGGTPSGRGGTTRQEDHVQAPNFLRPPTET